MKIAVWKTGHPIADTVAQALAEGFDADIIHTKDASIQTIKAYGAHVGYGILRGTSEVFRLCEQFAIPWLNVDRGYFNPSHYDGYYRISYRGTQARWHEGIPRKPVDITLEPRREYDRHKPILVCPPTPAVSDFFGLLGKIWRLPDSKYEIRNKGDASPIDWDRYSAVWTFNSSVGWKALQMGFPVLSDPDHSLIGSFYKTRNLNLLLENFHIAEDNRLQIFEAMQAHQFTLEEIKQGKAWPLIKHYLSMSAGIAENPSPPPSASTQFASGQSSQ